jgi:hypothetical protein
VNIFKSAINTFVNFKLYEKILFYVDFLFVVAIIFFSFSLNYSPINQLVISLLCGMCFSISGIIRFRMAKMLSVFIFAISIFIIVFALFNFSAK